MADTLQSRRPPGSSSNWARSNDLSVPQQTWGDTMLTLPRAMIGEEFRDVLVGRTISTRRDAGKAAISAAELFSSGLPIALLEASGKAAD